MLSLDDILAAPSDPDELNKHLIGRGLIPPMVAAPSTIAPATVGPLSPVTPAVKPMAPPKTDWLARETGGIHPLRPEPTMDMSEAPELGGAPLAGGAGPGSIVKPMVPPMAPTGKESIAAGMAMRPGLSAKEEGKRQFQEMRPQLTADPGSAEYSRQKLAQMEFDKLHPWGGDISAHPGLLGKIGHIAAKVGNIAGDVLAPGVMANIPGTDINKQIQEGDVKRELAGRTEAEEKSKTTGLENEQRAAQTERTKAETEQIGEPKGAEETTLHDLMTGGEGGQARINPDTQKPYSYLEAYETTKQAGQKPTAVAAGDKPLGEVGAQLNAGLKTRYQVLNPGKNLPPEFTLGPNATQKDYDRIDKLMENTEKASGTKAQQDAANELRKQAAEDRKATQGEKQEKEGEKWVTGEDENGKMVMVPKSQAKELGLKNLAEANADDVNKTKAARHVLPLLYNNDPKDPGVLQMIDNLDKKGKLGPLASRWNDFQTRKFGMDDPDYAALRGRMDLATTKLMQAHVGSRGGSFMLEHFENIANAKKMGAADLRAGVDQELRYIHDISQMPSKKKESAGGGEKTEKAGGAEFKVPEGAPSAEKVPDGKVLKDDSGKVVARAKGGKWQAP